MKTQFKNLFIVCILLIAACGGEKKGTEGDSNVKPISGDIKIDGSSTVYPISEAVAEDFKASFPDVRVTVGLSGTGGGFKKFSRGETDINDASRPIKQEEIDMCNSSNISYVELEVAFDGLSVVVNPKNTWCNDVTVAELKKIWEPEAQGKIMKWNQIRPEWPNKEIHLFGAGTESGTYDYFTEAIVGKSHSSRGDYTASEDDNVLVQGVSADENAMGFFGFAYYEENKDKLKLIGVDDNKDENGKGPIMPSIETVKNKTYSPLSRPLYIYINSSAVKRPEIQAFVNFYIENGAVLSKEVGFIPMTDLEYTTQKEKFAKFAEVHSK